MAEQVNQRIEGMINELEQMRRTELYDDEEIREIARKRKELEYKIQRRIKMKEDYVQYITYELALLEDIALRRKSVKLSEKKKDIEYAIAKRLNNVFKQFIYRYQNEIEIYFEYIKFCNSVGFYEAISGIIGQMLQVHGDKPKLWQMASKWERDQNNLDAAREFLLKGIHRHPKSEILYLDLFEIELLLVFKAEDPEKKEKNIKRTEVVWKNGANSIKSVNFLFKLCDIAMKYDTERSITNDIKTEIWNRRGNKDVWVYIATKELEGNHWLEIEEFVEKGNHYPLVIQNFMGVYEEALAQFPDEKLCTKYIHQLLGLSRTVCTDLQKIGAVKHAWMFGHENALLSNDMYSFGIEFLKVEDVLSRSEILAMVDAASKRNPRIRCCWEEKILFHESNEKKMMSILHEASKVLGAQDILYLWNLVLDKVESTETLKDLYKKFQNCESAVVLEIKPKLLEKMYKHNDIKAARELYEEFIRVPPAQIAVHRIIIGIEQQQEKPNLKNIRRYYECAVQYHGQNNVDLWSEYIKFESENGNAKAAPAIYRRAIATLQKELVDDFIKAQTLAKIQ